MLRSDLFRRLGFHAVTFVLVVLAAGSSAAHEQSVRIKVLGIPGYDTLLRDLANRGYTASLYGPANRPAEGFQVVSIGAKVPADTALTVLRMARSRIPSLQYVLLAGDHDSIATESNEITIGGTNGLMSDFPEARPLTAANLNELIGAGVKRPDLFYANVRSGYLGVTTAATGESNVTIREDGVIVVPREDGGADLYSSSGRKGVITPEGDERWPMSNLMGVRPVSETSGPDAAWMADLDTWLTWIAERQMQDIERLLGDDSAVQNYKNKEAEVADTLYDRVHTRRQYLSILIDIKNN